MALDFVAIDFETANFNRHSACAVGVARVRGGKIVEQTEWFIDPPGGPFFTNTPIHGIDEEHVVGAVSWTESLTMLERFVAGSDLVGYSGFDRSAYNAANKFFDLGHDAFVWRNAHSLVRGRYPLASSGLSDHKLPTMVRHFALGSFEHHQAGDDAAMCGRVVVSVANEHGIDDVGSLWPTKQNSGGRKAYTYRPSTPLPHRNEAADPAHPLFGEVLCFSGDLEGFTRPEAQKIVADFGATVGGGVTKKTSLVVMGKYDPATLRAGATLSTKIERALVLARGGQQIEVIEEQTFLELINLDASEYS